jgi:hypothetical protein
MMAALKRALPLYSLLPFTQSHLIKYKGGTRRLSPEGDFRRVASKVVDIVGHSLELEALVKKTKICRTVGFDQFTEQESKSS